MVSLIQPATHVPSTLRKDRDVYNYAAELCHRLKRRGVHSSNHMETAGFQYTGEGDTVRCTNCDLNISDWSREMDPFRTHLERSPQCPFVRSIEANNEAMLTRTESLAKRCKLNSDTGLSGEEKPPLELETLKQVRRRTFSHWPKHVTPTKDQLIEAGFFQCNVGDRVICIYCSLICQKWEKDVDDPVEVHKALSPHCPYVQFVLNLNKATPVLVLNGISTDNASNQKTLLDHAGRLQSDQIVHTNSCHARYASIIDRQATFATWTDQASPSVDDLVRAGFFYTGTKSIVTCFYCNGSLQNWGKNDTPLIEHIRWFPSCPYAKQLGGTELHDRIRSAQRARQELQNSKVSAYITSPETKNQLRITDAGLLSRLVAARLDLPVSRRLLSQNFKLSVIKRCWEDQLQMKNDDFVSDCDLYTACLILQKQIEHINGNKDNITIPSLKMQSLQHNEQPNNLASPQPSLTSSLTMLPAKTSSPETAPHQPLTGRVTNEQSIIDGTISQDKVTVSNPCLVCNKEEKRLACIPCGHLASCVSCSSTLRTCPTCRRGIEAFVRVYI